MSPSLTILVCPINAVGHVNACVGTTSVLVARGHRVIFVVEEAWSGKLAPRGIEEYLYQSEYFGKQKTGEQMAKSFAELGQFSRASAAEKAANFGKHFSSIEFHELWLKQNEAIVKALEIYQPNCIIADQHPLIPAVEYSGVPWINHCSCNPLFYLTEEDLPPACSGLPLNDPSQWASYRTSSKAYTHSKAFNDFIEQLGYQRYPEDRVYPDTAVLTVYATPEELNYPPLRGRPNYFNLEVFNKNASGKRVNLEQLVPKAFLEDNLGGRFTGRWIYLSMGSMGSINLELMGRLLAVLAKLPHKCIVSKGPLHDRYELPANCWGERFLPQTELLPQVDLVISHAGNNSMTEVFAQGKPMIVLPLSFDQFDNAQRLVETGYGIRLDSFTFTEEELVEAVDRLLADDVLQSKLKAAAKRIQQSDRLDQFAQLIEEMFCGKVAK